MIQAETREGRVQKGLQEESKRVGDREQPMIYDEGGGKGEENLGVALPQRTRQPTGATSSRPTDGVHFGFSS